MAQIFRKSWNSDTLVIDLLSVEFSNLPKEPLLKDAKIEEITQIDAVLKWETSEDTISKIKFLDNNCPSQGCEINVDVYNTSHIQTLKGLSANTDYLVKIVSISRTGITSESEIIKFKTKQIPIPASAPVILPQIEKLVYTTGNNTEIQSSFEWDSFRFPNFIYLEAQVNAQTTKIKYFFKNQPGAGANSEKISSVAVNGKISIILQNPKELGIYDLALIPIGKNNEEGEIIYKQVNIISNKELYIPDIKRIQYAQSIIEKDFGIRDYNIVLNVETFQDYKTNSYLSVKLEKQESDSILEKFLPFDETNPNKVSTLSFYAKDFLEKYKNKFVETDTTIIINFILEIYSVVGDKKIFGKPETVTLKIVKGNYQITDDEAIDKLSQPFIKLFSGNDTKQNYEDKISFEDDKYFYYRLRYETDTSQKSLPILNIGKDDVTYSLNGQIVEKTEFLIDDETGDTIRVQKTPYPTLVIKLAEPLPTDIDLNSLLWISRQITPTIVQDILISEIEEDECNTLLPNFNTEDLDDGGYEYFGKLVAEGSQTSTDIVNTFISSSNFNLTKLNINYTSGSDKTSESFIVFSNFVNFSGAQTRINNYQYKLSAVEFYNQKISASLYSGTTLSTSSYSLLTSESFNSIINGIKNGFDGFEKTLYNNFDVTSSNSTFFEYQREYAEKYDKENKNYLIRHIPSHLSEAGDNDEFLLFLEMIGQHFDVLWSYITGIKNKNNITNLSTKGISDTLVYNLLESFGWDPRTPFKTAELWKEAFGKNADGTTTSNINQVGESILTTYSYKDARNEIWRRILNNLPYLLKHKGTKRAVNAILTCYGVPSSLLTIIEFGGPNIRPLSSSTYTYDDRTAAINLSETEYITVPYISSSGYVATSVQTRFKTDYKIPKSTSVTGSQIIRKESVDGYWQVSIVPNFTSSFGDVIFTLKNLPTTETIQLSVTESVLFDDYWKNITIQKERFVSNSINYDRFDLFVKEAIDGRIIMNQSASAIHTASAVTNIFTNSGSLYLNSFNSTKGIDGTYDEFRIWNTALSESVVNAHALNPDVIYGNGIYSSTDNLLLRLDFEWPKDRIADPYIKNVSPSVTFSGSKAISGYAGYATASISTVSTTYPYQYEVYERSVTATIPSIGFAPNDKVRFEDVELVTDLSHISRATKKSFDRSSMDSNRIGLFFSPVKELNLDILKSLGPINIGDYIGDWQDEYGTDRYKDLDALRNYYFKRTNLSFEEYIKLVKSIDKSLFEMLLQVLPARAKINQGLLLEPSILERNKIKINKPTGNKVFYTSSISTQNTSFIEGKYDEYNTILNVALDRILTSSLLNLETNIKIVDNIDLDSEKLYYTSSIKTSDDIVLLASIIKNSISTMGGLEVEIDTRRESSVTGEYDQELSYESVGMDKDSPFTAGFGLVGQNGFVDRTYFKNDGTVVLTERNNAYILTIKYTRDIPNTNLSGITTYEKVEKLKKKLVIVDSEVVTPGSTSVKSALAHSFYTNIFSQLGTYRYDKGVVVEIYPFDGITYGHYRFVGDLTKGLQNSFYEGSKQTSLTTIDGTPAVETFTTNPNRLKISDSGRGSGEPILEVD